MNVVGAVMNFYSWGLAVVVIVFVYLIGRFFEEKAGQRSYYQVFLIPMVLLTLGALRYLVYGQDFVGTCRAICCSLGRRHHGPRQPLSPLADGRWQEMNVVTALLGSAGLIALIYATFFLVNVNQRIGAMTKMKPYYRWLYLAAFFQTIALLIRLLRTSVFWAPQQAPPLLTSGFFYLATYYVPLAVGMTIVLMVTVKYWAG